MFKRLFISTALIATCLVIGTANADTPDPDTLFTTGGVQAIANVGDVLATGTLENGMCNMPPVEVSTTLSDLYEGAEIVVEIDETCQMTFTSVTFTEATPGPVGVVMSASSSDAERFKGWVKSELNDPPGIDLASVYAETYYWSDGDDVWNGHNQSVHCDRFIPTQWRVRLCNLDYDGTGPSQIWVRGDGEFESDLIRPSHHHQIAYFWAYPNRGRFACYHTGFVIGWVNWRCNGTRYDH